MIGCRRTACALATLLILSVRSEPSQDVDERRALIQTPADRFETWHVTLGATIRVYHQ